MVICLTQLVPVALMGRHQRFRSAVVSLQRAVIVPTQRTKCLGAAVRHPLAVVKFLTRGAKHPGAKECHHGRMAVGTSRTQWNKCLGTEVRHRRALVKCLGLTFLSGIRLLRHVALCLGTVAAKRLCRHLPVMFRRRVPFRFLLPLVLFMAAWAESPLRLGATHLEIVWAAVFSMQVPVTACLGETCMAKPRQMELTSLLALFPQQEAGRQWLQAEILMGRILGRRKGRLRDFLMCPVRRVGQLSCLGSLERCPARTCLQARRLVVPTSHEAPLMQELVLLMGDTVRRH
mmetsp:Transcript_6483/g.18135  ORF Transcript_6483/g.18135 Transcript_6483/m.18135 type:complete len:289 (+) Transcript_6483:818-1684(+)